MMKIEIQIPGKMVQNGSGILRAIQNVNTPEADLFVRESIQNSLDAYNKDSTEVYVDFTINKFQTTSLSGELELIGEVLIDNFSQTEEFLCVRDYNTVGLTGPLSHEDIEDGEYGNLVKLVYDISKPQEREGAGGSWGYGKTIFYRIGMGLVFYYSRVKIKGNDYQERLVGVMVENEKKADTLIPSYKDKTQTGVAWWGEKVKENKTIPITDSSYIRWFLDIFNIEPYVKEETGTAIIIPFINQDQILKHNVYGSEQREKRINYYDDLMDYLKYSVQRWYFPRLNNPSYQFSNKKSLKVSINNEMIEYESQEPYFQLMLDLYNYASTGSNKNLRYLKNLENISKETINLRTSENAKLLTSNVGSVVFGKFSYKDLNMGSAGLLANPHFLANLDQEDNEMNHPILAFTRGPGMIINYEDKSRWTNSINPTTNETYLLGIFVLNSINELNINNEDITLEEYVRQGERADHTSWEDHSSLGVNPGIIRRIQNNLVNKIRQEYEEKVETMATDNDGRISKIFGESILPKSDFGKKASRDRKILPPSDVVRKTKLMKTSMQIDNIQYGVNQIMLPFYLEVLTDSVNIIEIELVIDTESSFLSIPKFELDVTKDSPVFIERLEFNRDRSYHEHSNKINDFVVIKSDNGTVYKLILNSQYYKNESIYGEITIKTNSLEISPLIRIRAKEYKDGKD